MLTNQQWISSNEKSVVGLPASDYSLLVCCWFLKPATDFSLLIVNNSSISNEKSVADYIIFIKLIFLYIKMTFNLFN